MITISIKHYHHIHAPSTSTKHAVYITKPYPKKPKLLPPLPTSQSSFTNHPNIVVPYKPHLSQLYRLNISAQSNTTNTPNDGTWIWILTWKSRHGEGGWDCDCGGEGDDVSRGEEGERDGFVGVDGDGGADVAFERVGVGLWRRRLDEWGLSVGEDVVGGGSCCGRTDEEGEGEDGEHDI